MQVVGEAVREAEAGTKLAKLESQSERPMCGGTERNEGEGNGKGVAMR